MSGVATLAAHYSTDEVAADLRGAAKALGSRKILRFLDGASLAPFVAAAEVYRRNPCADPAAVSLYTVSGWDGAQPDPPFVPDGSTDGDADLARHILEDANPTAWLRMLGNNALCQVSIVEGFRGPNAHLVGDAEALWQALVAAGADLAGERTDLAIVVAYDPPPEQVHNPSERTDSAATALALRRGDGPDPLAAALDTALDAALAGRGALETMNEIVRAHAGSPR